MPVIRVATTAKGVSRKERQTLVKELSRELAGETTENGPVIFEIPLEGSDKMDALVVWEKWKALPSEIRSEIILEAYKEKKDNISQPLGMTYKEAIEQEVLPYAVVPMTREGEVDAAALKAAMLKQGGFALDGDKVDLRFPTMEMAREAHRKLCDELPKGYWSIVQAVGPIS